MNPQNPNMKTGNLNTINKVPNTINKAPNTKFTLKKVTSDALVWRPEKSAPPVLDGISFEFEAGEFYGILGPNGAGKTSFVRCLNALAEPTEGEVSLDSVSLKHIPRKEIAGRISFLPQGINPEIEFTVWEIVAMGREPHRSFLASLSETDLRLIDEAMELTGCSNLRDKKFSVLSGGERQRVMIARTVAQDSPWIILDEPVSNLDVSRQKLLMSLLTKLRKERGKTIIAVLHDINLASAFCSRIILLKDGKIKYSGTVAETLTGANLSEIYGISFTEYINDDGKSVIMPIYE